MASSSFSRWPLQTLGGIALVMIVSTGLGSLQSQAPQSPAPQAPAAQAAGGDTCPDGFYGTPGTGCTDVNECATGNGGCHKLASCTNTPGSRTCGECPKDFAGTGYVGCFDVNECPYGDCSDRVPKDPDTAPPPVVTASGDVTVDAVSEAGAPATFTVSAKDERGRLRSAYCMPRSGATFPIGKTIVSCWSTNTVGKLGRTTLTVTVNRPSFE